MNQWMNGHYHTLKYLCQSWKLYHSFPTSFESFGLTPPRVFGLNPDAWASISITHITASKYFKHSFEVYSWSVESKKKKKNCFLCVDKITMHKTRTLCKNQVSNTLWKGKSLHTWASVSFVRKSGILQESLNNSVEQTSSIPVGFISNCWWTNRK